MILVLQSDCQLFMGKLNKSEEEWNCEESADNREER